MELITLLSTTIPDWLEAILGLLVALQIIATLTPTPKDDEVVGKVLTYVRTIVSALSYKPTVTKPKSDEDVK